MGVKTVNKVLTVLLIYCVGLILLSGMFGKHIEDDLARILLMYGVPLIIVALLYLVAIGFEIHSYIKVKTMAYRLALLASIKMALAVIPMFFLNNTMASLLMALRIK